MKSEHIIKTDRLGRMTTSQARREQLLAQYDQSGMSGGQFAKWVGMKYSTLASWIQKRRAEQESGVEAQVEQKSEVQWVEAVLKSDCARKLTAENKSTGMIVHGPGGIWLELKHEEHVAWASKLLRHLETTC